MTFLLGIGAFAKRIPLIAWAVLAVLSLVMIRQCEKARNEAAQARVDAGQAGAASKSAGDAVNTVAASGEREASSEELTRDNAREIASAQGADVKATPAVDLAGRRALCKRSAYANDPKCKDFRQ